MKKFALYDCDNDIAFGFEVKDEDFDKAVGCAYAGLKYWYMADSDDIEDTEDFTKEEIADFLYLGYAEPSEMLMKKNGIEFTPLDVDCDTDGTAEGIEEFGY